MRKIFLSRAVLLIFLCWLGTTFMVIAPSVAASLLGNVKPKSSGGSTVSRNDLDAIYKLVTDANYLLFKSLSVTRKMLSNKEEKFKLENEIRSIESIKDPKEKEAAIRKFNEDMVSRLEIESKRQENNAKIESLSAEQKVLFGNAIYNVALAGLRDLAAVDRAQRIIKVIQGNPSYAVNYAGDLDTLKNIVTTVPPQANKAANIGNNFAKLAKANKIEVALPANSESKPKDATDSLGEDPVLNAKAEDTGNQGTSPEKGQRTQAKGEPTLESKETPKAEAPEIKEASLKDNPQPEAKMVEITWTFVLLRSDKGSEFSKVAEVKKGDKLSLIREDGDWLMVRCADNKEGWISKTVCKIKQ